MIMTYINLNTLDDMLHTEMLFKYYAFLYENYSKEEIEDIDSKLRVFDYKFQNIKDVYILSHLILKPTPTLPLSLSQAMNLKYIYGVDV